MRLKRQVGRSHGAVAATADKAAGGAGGSERGGAPNEAVDEQQIGDVVRPSGGRVVDDEDELGHTEQPLQRLRRAVERGIPREHLRRV